MRYTHVFAGGTFDRLHKGHKALLFRAFETGRRVTIGLTSDQFVKQYKTKPIDIHPLSKSSSSESQIRKHHIQPYSLRLTYLNRWLTTNGFMHKAAIVPIDDPLEPAASDASFDSIVVTQENESRGIEINTIRVQRTLLPLTLINVPIVPARDDKPISSTRVRSGEIDPNGNLVLPRALRPLLRNPMGILLTDKKAVEQSFMVNKRNIVITVGDVTTEQAITHGIIPHISIIDLQVGRRPYKKLDAFGFPATVQVTKTSSGPGYISRQAQADIKRLCQELHADTPPQVLLVDGEEDLLVLPVVLTIPVGSIVYYGQPPVGDNPAGIVEITVKLATIARVRSILNKFQTKRYVHRANR